MSAIDAPELPAQTVLSRWASPSWSLVAAGLLLASAALQLEASLQRWVVFRAGRPPEEFAGESGNYNYFFPVGEWEHIGTTAQVFGAANLLLALGVLVMAFSVWALPRATRSRRAVAAEIGLVILVAAVFGLSGVHALISGLTGAPSPLQSLALLILLAVPGLIALALLWAHVWAASIACLLLLGSTVLGYFAASLAAPLLTGYVSHDTTPWTETIVAASTAAAGVVMFLGAWAGARRGTLAAQATGSSRSNQVPA